jgi:hypothetical protein
LDAIRRHRKDADIRSRKVRLPHGPGGIVYDRYETAFLAAKAPPTIFLRSSSDSSFAVGAGLPFFGSGLGLLGPFTFASWLQSQLRFREAYAPFLASNAPPTTFLSSSSESSFAVGEGLPFFGSVFGFFGSATFIFLKEFA